MNNVVATNEDIARFADKNRTELILKFDYPTIYHETINKRDFNLYAFLSQMCGIAGIFLSQFLQKIPETVTSIRSSIKNGKFRFRPRIC